MHVLVTGAAGRIGRMLIAPLRATGDRVTLTDLRPDDAEEITPLDVTDTAAVIAACHGVDAIVHLAGVPGEAPFPTVNAVNVGGTHNILEGAVAAGVRRVIIASSNHAVGFYRRSDATPVSGSGANKGDLSAADMRVELADPAAPRPDTFYGWSKAAMEALGSLYHDRYGLEVIALRIGTCFARPPDTRALSTWLSPRDVGRVVLACLTAENVGYRAVFAVSDNTRRWWSIDGTTELGFVSADDAEEFAPELIVRYGEPDLSDPVHDRVGGGFTRAPLGERPPGD